MIRFKAYNNGQWWYEGEMNGFVNYRCRMEKCGDDWSFWRGREKVAGSSFGNKLEVVDEKSFRQA